MECNKDEAARAREIAEKKLANNDFDGARKFASKAQNLYPELENISQILSICDVHCSAQKSTLGSERDWYGVLQVERFSDESTIKKQYRRLALILHPDKNRFAGAEGAFKLICEANAVLSDTAKKSLYDSKIRVLARPAPVNQPPNNARKSTQPNKQNGAWNNVATSFSSLNQHQATWSTSSVRQDVFWTCCPFCRIQYQYQREYVNRTLLCSTCKKSFMACEILAQGVPLGPKWGQPGVHMPPKPCSSRPAYFHEKVVLNQSNFNTNVHNKRTSASHSVSQGIGNGKVQPDSGVPKSTHVAGAFKKSGNLKASKKDNPNVSSVPGGKDSGKSNGVADKREPELKRNIKKQDRKFIVESSESCDTFSDSDLEDSIAEGNVADSANNPSSGPCVRSSRRSLRRKQHISYIESDDDDDEDLFSSPLKKPKASEKSEVDKEKLKHVSDGEDFKSCNQNNFPVDKDFSKSECNEKVKTNSDSDQESSSSDDLDDNRFDCPDAEFNDFDSLRNANQFQVNQIWACYDAFDGMPRFYAKVKKASALPFEVSITWLEPVPIDEAYESWVQKDLPVGCGTFKLGETEVTSKRLTFSHQVHFDKGRKRGSLIIYPREGEVWAIIKGWNMNWSSDPENHKEFKYEIVEVLSDFIAGVGIKVNYLDKVEGFVSLFHRSSQSYTTSFVVGPNELYKFSHCIPSFKMTGSEREGVPVGSFELDPASLPLNPDNLFYFSKVKMEKRNMDSGVHRSPPKSAKGKGSL